MDQNKFINTYIDVSINSLLEYVKSNLQLQTQVKVHEFVVGEKDQIIADLTKQLTENKIAEDWKVKYEAAETNYSEILKKLSHMDTLLNQVGEMKKTIISKDVEIDLLKKEIEELKSPSPKKVINTKISKKIDQGSLVQQTSKLDDF